MQAEALRLAEEHRAGLDVDRLGRSARAEDEVAARAAQQESAAAAITAASLLHASSSGDSESRECLRRDERGLDEGVAFAE